MAEEDPDLMVLKLGEAEQQLEFRRLEDFERWFVSERAKWEWLRPAEKRLNLGGVAEVMTSAFSEIPQLVEQARLESRPLAWLQEHVENRYGHRAGVLRYSGAGPGALLLDVYAAAGDEAAAFAYAYLLGRLNPSQASKVDHLQGLLTLAVPEMAKPAELANRLSTERANYRSATRSAIERMDRARDEQEARLASLFRRGRELTRRLMRSRIEFARATQEDWHSGANQAVADIRAVQKAFEESMSLQAPVKYWTRKAKTHGRRETWAAASVVLFFVAAIGGLGIAFYMAGNYVLEVAERARSVGRPEPTAMYIVVTGGLAALTTLTFWIGRLLTRLHLSEHHLRNDAHERAVMTTTYLALTRNEKAEEIDRQIILNALFRNSPDGIVKEDSGPDIGIQGKR